MEQKNRNAQSLGQSSQGNVDNFKKLDKIQNILNAIEGKLDDIEEKEKRLTEQFNKENPDFNKKNGLASLSGNSHINLSENNSEQNDLKKESSYNESQVTSIENDEVGGVQESLQEQELSREGDELPIVQKKEVLKQQEQSADNVIDADTVIYADNEDNQVGLNDRKIKNSSSSNSGTPREEVFFEK